MAATIKINLDDYARHFSDSKLWKKLKAVARKAGRKAVYHVLVLYYVSRDPSVPTQLKVKILGALGYFILPLDIIPDAILGLGFTDDVVALAWAFNAIRKYITPAIEEKASKRLEEWFGPEDGTTGTVAGGLDDARIIDVDAWEVS